MKTDTQRILHRSMVKALDLPDNLIHVGTAMNGNTYLQVDRVGHPMTKGIFPKIKQLLKKYDIPFLEVGIRRLQFSNTLDLDALSGLIRIIN